jgi:hypothetical protein
MHKKKWYSICSKHKEKQEDCLLCQKGRYISNTETTWNNIFYALSPTLWRLWANRKGSKSRKFLEETFPNLKK